MPAPSNLTPTTAVDLSIILTSSIIEVNLALAPTQSTAYASTFNSGNPALNYKEVWYKYTTKANERCFSVDANYSASASYDPILSIWTGATVLTLTQYQIVGPSETQEFALSTGGGFGFFVPCQELTTYYFQVIDSSNAAPGAGLVFTVYEAPINILPAGALLICDDVDYFPAAILSPVNGGPLKYIADYPAGESADTQPNGIICCQNGEADTGVKLFNSLFALITTISYSPGNVTAIKSDKNGNFYILVKPGGAAVLYKITSAGVAVTNWTLPANSSSAIVCAVNRAGTIFYYGSRSSGAAIHAYDLSGGAALPDLYAGIGTEYPVGFGCGCVDTSGNIYIMYGSNVGGSTPKLRKFSSAGVLLLTQALTTASFIKNNRMDIDYTDDAVWLWGLGSSSTPTILQRRLLSDLSLDLEIVTIPTYSTSGLWASANEEFGVSNSCPLLVLPLVTNVLSGIYKLLPGRRNDELYLTYSPVTTEERAIPEPSATTGYLGDV